MNFKFFTQYTIITLLFLCGSMTSVFSQCEIGSSPDCPIVYTVCPNEQINVSMGDFGIPLPPISVELDIGMLDFSNVTYIFSTGGNTVCTDCYSLPFTQHTETKLYKMEWINSFFPTPPDLYYGTKYILIEVEDCVFNTDTDIGNVEITKPTQLLSSGYQPISYSFTNIGSGQLYNYEAFLEINGEIIQQKTVNLSSPTKPGQKSQGSFDSYNFEALPSGNNIKIWLTNPNGYQDTDPSNNSVEVNFEPFLLEYNINLAFVSPIVPFENGDNDIIVQVRNFSNVGIEDFVVNWSVNGQTQPIHNGVDLLVNEFRTINLGSYPLDTNTDYEILINAELPDNLTDSTPSDNALSFIYESEKYEYYSADEFYEICPGDSVNLKYVIEDFDITCFNCDISIAESFWTIDGVEFSTENDLWITPNTSVVIQLSGTTDFDCSPINSCFTTGAVGPYPANPLPVIEKSFGIIVNDCNEDPEPPNPVETPDCANHSGMIFFETCENQEYFFIETSEGTILDPYFANGIVFNYYDGQNINFDYETAAFATTCTNAQEAAIITCIEEAETIIDTINTNTAVFNDYPWLNNIVDLTNCNGTTIEIYDLGAYAFVNITTTETSTLYFEDGTYYCQNGNNLNCVNSYGLSNPTSTWTCGNDIPTPPSNDEIFTTYTWLGNLISPNNCEGTMVNIFDLGAYAFIQIIDNESATLYFEDGTFYCQDGGGLNCIQAYSLNTPTDTWTCGDVNPNPPSTDNEIFTTYTWLGNLVNLNNCAGTTVNVFDLGAYAFIQVIDSENATLYFEDGTFYCQDGGGLNCIQAYSLDNPTDTWTCNDLNTPPPTTPPIFGKYPWLSAFYFSVNCNGSYESITEYDLGGYSFIYVQGTNFGMLYFEDGTPYCNNADFDCLNIYNLTNPTDITVCSMDKPAGDDSNAINEHASKLPTELTPKWSVYPNPTSGHFTIEVNDQNKNLNLISIYNIQGKVVEEVLIDRNQNVLNFNLEYLDNGMYFVALQYGNKTEVKKLMFKR